MDGYNGGRTSGFYYHWTYWSENDTLDELVIQLDVLVGHTGWTQVRPCMFPISRPSHHDAPSVKGLGGVRVNATGTGTFLIERA